MQNIFESLSSSDDDIDRCIIIRKLLVYIFNAWWEPNSPFRWFRWTHGEFSSVRFSTRGVTYPQRCFRHTIDKWRQIYANYETMKLIGVQLLVIQATNIQREPAISNISIFKLHARSIENESAVSINWLLAQPAMLEKSSSNAQGLIPSEQSGHIAEVTARQHIKQYSHWNLAIALAEQPLFSFYRVFCLETCL